jgi:hypothetical protein
MVFHMKTTLVIDDITMTRLRERAAREGSTISELVESALRLLLDRPEAEPRRLPPLPSYRMGKPLVDVANREELYRALDAEKDKRLYGGATARESPPPRYPSSPAKPRRPRKGR